MSDYRIYMLDGEGRIVKGLDAACEDDEAARAAALFLMQDGGEAEVWQAARCVGRVSASLQHMAS